MISGRDSIRRAARFPAAPEILLPGAEAGGAVLTGRNSPDIDRPV
jgi:hypothetical protein